MIQKFAWRGVLIVVLSLAVARRVEARGFPNANAIGAAIVATAVAVVVVAVVVIHELSKKRTIQDVSTTEESGFPRLCFTFA